MVIENFKIRLKKICFDDLENLRNWRNSEYVNKQMFYNQYITSDMQQYWFNNLDKDLNYYFIAIYNDENVGVIHIKNIMNNVGEGGIFLVDSKFENTDIVARMILCFNDFVFYKLKIDCIYSKVKKSNKKAISSSKAQGCVENVLKSNGEVIHFELSPTNYERKVFKIKKIIK